MAKATHPITVSTVLKFFIICTIILRLLELLGKVTTICCDGRALRVLIMRKCLVQTARLANASTASHPTRDTISTIQPTRPLVMAQ